MFWLKLPPVAEMGYVAWLQHRSGMLSGVPAARAFDADSTMAESRMRRSASISQSLSSKLVDRAWFVPTGVTGHDLQAELQGELLEPQEEVTGGQTAAREIGHDRPTGVGCDPLLAWAVQGQAVTDEVARWTSDRGNEDVALAIAVRPGHGDPLVVVVDRRVELLKHPNMPVVHQNVVAQVSA